MFRLYTSVMVILLTSNTYLQYVKKQNIIGSVFGKRDLLAMFHFMKTNLIAEKLAFQMLQTILKYS